MVFQNHGLCPGFAGFLRPVAGVADGHHYAEKLDLAKARARKSILLSKTPIGPLRYSPPGTTVLGATFMCLAPEHPMVEILSRNTSQAQTIVDFQERMAAENRSSQTIETL
ncbi:MAG: hypothetical protein R2874_09125 [Desulfobacterales bacterium]